MARKEREVKELVPVDDSKYVGSNLPVTQEDFSALSTQRKMLKDFVGKQLVKDVDYGIIPGTPKPCLYKPGAEKILRLFGLGVRMNKTDSDIDRVANFAMYVYKAEVFHLKTNQVIAECEGVCNSHEKKYKTRAIYEGYGRNRRKTGEEQTPCSDVLNTIMKMAQKRAMVGAAILAVGASDFFSQDLEGDDDRAGNDIPKEPEQKSQFASDDRVVRIAKLFESCRKHGISQADITRKFNLKKAEDITDDQANELAGFGRQIANKEKTVKELFEVKNENA